MSRAGVRRRLTTWYAVSTLTLLVVALLGMRTYARHALEREHEIATARAMELVRSFVRAEMAEFRNVSFTISHVASELVFAGMRIDFLRPGGTVFASARRPLRFGDPAPPVIERSAPLESALAPGWTLRVRISTADLEAARRRIDRLTLAALALAALLATMVAWFMTGRALAPVGAMAAAASQLGSDPSSRLPIANPRDEFGRLGRAFNDLLERLEGAVAQQRRFLADAAHELRTPLARMRVESDLRLAAPPSNEDRDTLVRIGEELQGISRLVDELLHIAQSDSGAMQMETRTLFLDDVVADAIAPWEAEMTRRQLRLDVSRLQEARVVGDPMLLQRLIVVLLDNAVRYTPDGGRVSVSVHREDERVRLTVEDSGIGIPHSERAKVFERFGRGAEARQRVPHGSGLGLAIAANIVRRHDASIAISDSGLGGARFDVLFPAV
ncbi:MAG: HAMP domain-containing histidine kinase [Gemmatimonadaceae bacterium]|nr:HAMP domain-containing histidine kinase [Gemmatimonadaceae bacterium]